jgi:hypothetical protein
MKTYGIGISVAVTLLIALGRGISAQEATETAVGLSETPVVEATATQVTPPATPAVEPSAAADGSFKVLLNEDLDGDRAKSAGDSVATRSTLVELIPWAEVEANGNPRIVLRLFTAPDGTFEFKDVPPGDYTLAIWWQAGFAAGATPDVPDVLQAVFSIDKAGVVKAPSALPELLPGVVGSQEGERNGVTFIGSLPTEVLLNKIDPNVVPFPVSSGQAPLAPVQGGVLSVRQALSDGQPPDVQPTLPATGEGSSDSSPMRLWAFAVAAAMLALVVVYRTAPWKRRG